MTAGPSARRPDPKHAIFNKPVLLTALIAGLLLAALSIFKLVIQPQIIKGFLAKNIPPPATISTEPATTVSWINRLASVGTLTAIQGIDVAPQVAGVVSAIYFDSGTEVKAGAKLIDLDTSVEVADLANNEATLRQTDADLARQNDLSRRAIASAATQQTSQAKRDNAAAAVAKAKALIAQKRIVAPFAGRVGIRKVELGQYVSAGGVLASLQQLDPMRVDFPVPENKLPQLELGQAVEVTVDAFPGRTFKGAIKSLDARVSADTRTLLIRAEVANPDGKLLPGMFAKVNVITGSPHDEITVPRTSVTYSLYGDSVYVVVPAAAATGAPAQAGVNATPSAPEPNLIAERRFVRISDTREDRVSISEGLQQGELVVVAGQLKLQPGARVRVDNSQPLTPPAERPRI